jgi:hypothetical protein
MTEEEKKTRVRGENVTLWCMWKFQNEVCEVFKMYNIIHDLETWRCESCLSLIDKVKVKWKTYMSVGVMKVICLL